MILKFIYLIYTSFTKSLAFLLSRCVYLKNSAFLAFQSRFRARHECTEQRSHPALGQTSARHELSPGTTQYDHPSTSKTQVPAQKVPVTRSHSGGQHARTEAQDLGIGRRKRHVHASWKHAEPRCIRVRNGLLPARFRVQVRLIALLRNCLFVHELVVERIKIAMLKD